ncbi:MAG: hypothetical protein ACM3X1_06700 [Ignavibacteriales bacterium]
MKGFETARTPIISGFGGMGDRFHLIIPPNEIPSLSKFHRSTFEAIPVLHILSYRLQTLQQISYRRRMIIKGQL